MDQRQSYPTDEPAGPGPAAAEGFRPPRAPETQAAPGAPGQWAREAPQGPDPRRKSPALACVLSMMPGLGQVYVGYYQRGFINILVVGATIAFLAGGGVSALVPLGGIFLPFFWLYNIVDAGRRAALYNLALQGAGPVALPDEFGVPGLRGTLVGGSVLILLGLVLLLHTRFGVSLDWVEEWWPAAPILFGAYLVYKAIRNRPPAA